MRMFRSDFLICCLSPCDLPRAQSLDGALSFIECGILAEFRSRRRDTNFLCQRHIMPLVDPVTMSTTVTKGSSTQPANAKVVVGPVPRYNDVVALGFTIVHPLVLGALFVWKFGELVADPATTLYNGLPVVAAVQAVHAIACFPAAGSPLGRSAKKARPGEKKKEATGPNPIVVSNVKKLNTRTTQLMGSSDRGSRPYSRCDRNTRSLRSPYSLPRALPYSCARNFLVLRPSRRPRSLPYLLLSWCQHCSSPGHSWTFGTYRSDIWRLCGCICWRVAGRRTYPT